MSWRHAILVPLFLGFTACATLGANGGLFETGCTADVDCPGGACQSGQCVAAAPTNTPPDVAPGCISDADCPGGSCMGGGCQSIPPPDSSGVVGTSCTSGANCYGGTCSGPDCQ